MKTLKIYSVIVMLCIFNIANAQKFTQTIKGKVIDKQSQVALPGANIVIIGTNPPIGCATDIDGYFKLINVPVGRVNLQISFIGYQPRVLNGLNLTTGKELILNIELEEEVVNMKEVVVNGEKNKGESLNKMASISARTFSVEESQRFAGARNDVSRMATNYAGVSTANDAVNDIVIRGNSPNGLLWRLEGIEIPNPNHFGNMGGTGGPVSMLNNNVLSNSDFMTSAFPAEYGDAFSGVFDLKMRTGNYEKHEFLGQIGFNGFELGAEGPLFGNNKASYLINYRYSTLGVMSALGINFGTGTAIPQYQDLSFKFNFPTKKAGTFTLFGLGGISSITFNNSNKDTLKTEETMYGDDGFDVVSSGKTGIVGLTHSYIFGPKAYLKTTIATTGINNFVTSDTVLGYKHTAPRFRVNENNINYIASVIYNIKPNSKHNVKIGLTAKSLGFDLVDSIYSSQYNKFITLGNSTGNTFMYQPFVEWQYRITGNITLNSGVFSQYLDLNGSYSVEPRAGCKITLKPGHSINFGYGMHSKSLPLRVYFIETRLADGTYTKTNKDVDFIRSNHFVAGYDWNISNTLRLKTEAYFQDIFQAVVENRPTPYSLLNYSSFNGEILDSLTNGGKGINYGIELTVEKFLDHGLYGLVTASLYKSEYKGSNSKTYPTLFDGGYAVNLLGGKEFVLSPKNETNKYKKVILVDGRICSSGGQRYTPVDIEKSQASGSTVYDEERTFGKKFSDYFRADIRVAFRLEGAKISQEFAFDIQNVSNHKNPLYMKYNTKTASEETVYQLGLFPMIQYKIEF